MITDEQAAGLVNAALGVSPTSVTRQGLTESGNAVFRADLPAGRAVVLRVSPKPRAFAFTGANLDALRRLGLPVQNLLGSGPTDTGGSFILLDWLPGRDLVHELPGLSPAQMTAVAETVTDFQKRIGTLPRSTGFGWAPIGMNAATTSWSEIFGPASPDRPTVPLKARLWEIRRGVEAYFTTVQPVCFLDDLTIKNVLIENGRVSGILDVDFVCFGDPLMSVGTTIALLAADASESGNFYGEELLRCWQPSEDARRAVGFYAALWAVGMLNGAVASGDKDRASRLAVVADSLLRAAELQAAPSKPLTADQRLALATGHHRAGELAEARRLYQSVVDEFPRNAVASFRFGLLDFQEGKLESALDRVDKAIELAPIESRYRFGRGEVLMAMKRFADAAGAYRTAVASDPASVDAHFALGLALQSSGDHRSAIAAYESVIRLQPDHADAWNNLGNCKKIRRDLPGAESAYRRAIELRPGFAGAMSNLGTILQETGRDVEAMQLLRAAIAAEPAVVSHVVNLGAALCQQRLFTEAAELLAKALAVEPGNVDTIFNLANALYGLGQLPQAAEQYRRAAAIRPDHADALNNLGNVLKELGDFGAALTAYQSAVAARPGNVVTLNNLGCLFRTLNQLEEAETALRQALAADAGHPAPWDNLASVLKDAGQLDESIACYRQSLELNPADWATHTNLAYALNFSSVEPGPILDECRRFDARHTAGLMPAELPRLTNPAGRKIRIGYFSADFRDHCSSTFTIPLLSHHDHSRFEIFCYASLERPDDFTRRIKGYADAWRDVQAIDDAALAELIRADGIDILVDLTMFMARGRPLAFARKPAPVQIAFLAYPGTTGISAMDYRFSDSRLDPPGYESHYSERTIHLPDSFWCYDPLTAEPQVNELPAIKAGHITLGCLNNPCKLTDHTLRLWTGVMKGLPRARLLVMAPPGSYRSRLVTRMDRVGIDTTRVEFVAYRPRAEYLRTYHRIDLGLDTLPYNGHTTSLDSTWMGVPVVTRVGRTCVGRAGLSQLFQLNLTELSAESDEAFVQTAIALATDLPRLAELRKTLRGRIESSPLMDGSRFTRNVEAVYSRLMQEPAARVPAGPAQVVRV